jgi:PAS domain-containing protein
MSPKSITAWAFIGFCALSVPASAQTIKETGTAIGGEILRPIEQVPWFNNPDVRNQIKLNNDQYNSLTKDYDTYWHKYTTGRTKLDDELDDIARRRRERELHQEFQESLSRSLDRVITDRVARRRYDELYNQYQGYQVFHNPRFRKQLELTSEQLGELELLDREWNVELDRIRRNFEINRPVAMRELKHARRQMKERIQETLTPEQNELYAQLTGQTYEFPPEIYIPTPPKPRVEVDTPATDE